MGEMNDTRQKWGQVEDGVRLRYWDSGGGDGKRPFLMLHGWSQCAVEFKRQFEALAQSRRVLAPDFRGHGDSDKPDAGAGHVSVHARDVHAFLRTLNLGEVDILGHSMGCEVIWQYISVYGQDDFGKIILADQGPSLTARPGWSEEDCARWGALFPAPGALWDFSAAVKAADTAESLADLIAMLFTPDISREDLLWFAAQNLKTPRDVAADLLIDDCIQDWRDAIGKICKPTLVIGGEASAVPAASQKWIAEQIPGARVEIFSAAEGGSHFMFWENPNKFNELVNDFLG